LLGVLFTLIASSVKAEAEASTHTGLPALNLVSPPGKVSPADLHP